MQKNTSEKHEWAFEQGVSDRHSRPVMKYIKESVLEIKKVAEKDLVLGADGAVLFLEKILLVKEMGSVLSKMGPSVNHTVKSLVPIIAKAPVKDMTRDKWLARLWEAVQKSGRHSLLLLALLERWSDLCVTSHRISNWIEVFRDKMLLDWRSETFESCVDFKGATACLSALFNTKRYEEILALLALSQHRWWYERKWGAKALAAMGKVHKAVQYAQSAWTWWHDSKPIAQVCEEILLSAGLSDEAYMRFAILANKKHTRLLTFSAIVKKYPDKSPRDILSDLIGSDPYMAGQWFSAARFAGLYDEALMLAYQRSCDIKVITATVKKKMDTDPQFATELGMAALTSLVKDRCYNFERAYVHSVYFDTLEAAEKIGSQKEISSRIRKLVLEIGGKPGVTKILREKLKLPPFHLKS